MTSNIPRAVTPIHPAAPDGGASRSCGDCTACCKGWLTANIRGQELSLGKPCQFLGTGGCTIYEERPVDPCRSFVCGWLRKGSPFPESFRPDLIGVILIAKKWRDRVAYVLVSAGSTPDAALLEWMREYSAKTGTPFLFNLEGRPRGYGSPEFQKDIYERAVRGEPLLPGLNPRPGGPCKLLPLEI